MIPGHDTACKSAAIEFLEKGVFEEKFVVVLSELPVERMAMGDNQVQVHFFGERQVFASIIGQLRRVAAWGGDETTVVVMKDVVGSEGVDFLPQDFLFHPQASDCGPSCPVSRHDDRQWVKGSIGRESESRATRS